MFIKMLLSLSLLVSCYGGPSKLGEQNGSGNARLYAPSPLSDVDGVRSYAYNPDAQINQVFNLLDFAHFIISVGQFHI